MSRIISLIILCLFVSFPVSAQRLSKKGPKMQSVAIFGVGISFTDSIVYQTELQILDSAWVYKDHQFLEDRALYSLQLQYFMERQGIKNSVCSILFNTSEGKLRGQWEKIRKRHSVSPTQRFRVVPLSEFRFKAEEYRPVIIEEDE